MITSILETSNQTTNKTNPKREKRDRRLNFRLSSADYAKLDEISLKQGLSIGELIRRSLKATILANS